MCDGRGKSWPRRIERVQTGTDRRKEWMFGYQRIRARDPKDGPMSSRPTGQAELLSPSMPKQRQHNLQRDQDNHDDLEKLDPPPAGLAGEQVEHVAHRVQLPPD